MPTVTWKQSTRKYSSGEDAFLGRWRVGGYFWDSITSQKGENLPWKTVSFLPGIKPTLGNRATEELARARVEQAVEYWLAYTDPGA